MLRQVFNRVLLVGAAVDPDTDTQPGIQSIQHYSASTLVLGPAEIGPMILLFLSPNVTVYPVTNPRASSRVSASQLTAILLLLNLVM